MIRFIFNIFGRVRMLHRWDYIIHILPHQTTHNVWYLDSGGESDPSVMKCPFSFLSSGFRPWWFLSESIRNDPFFVELHSWRCEVCWYSLFHLNPVQLTDTLITPSETPLKQNVESKKNHFIIYRAMLLFHVAKVQLGDGITTRSLDQLTYLCTVECQCKH